MIHLNVEHNTQSNISNTDTFSNSARIVLLGEFLEKKDANNNTILSEKTQLFYITVYHHVILKL